VVESLRIRFLDVGQGDAIVAILPGGIRAAVVDVCDAERVLDFIEAEKVREIVLFITHSHADHTRGAEILLAALADETCPATLIAVFCGQDRLGLTDGYRQLLRLTGNAMRRLTRSQPRNPSNDFNTQLNSLGPFRELFGSVRVTVVHPEYADRLSLAGVNPNETAGVLLFELPLSDGKTRRALLTGDVQLTGISLMLARDRSLLRSDVLKYPHHGAWPTAWPGLRQVEPQVARCSMAEFLQAVMPSHVVFSVGRANPDGHIHPQTIAAIDRHFRVNRSLRSVHCTQATPNSLNSTAVRKDGPLADLSDSGDIEVRFSALADTDIEITTYPTSKK
jgi:competence protein ComEC